MSMKNTKSALGLREVQDNYLLFKQQYDSSGVPLGFDEQDRLAHTIINSVNRSFLRKEGDRNGNLKYYFTPFLTIDEADSIELKFKN